MKKILKTLLVCSSIIVGGASLASCSSGETYDYTIGVCNYVSDASLNQIVKNIEDTLNTSTKKIKIIDKNAEADSSTLSQIVSDFVAEDVDLMIGIATPVAMQMQNATKKNKIPVVFSAVSDPEGCNLVESNAKPGANITGTSDYLNTDAIIDMMLCQNPEMKKVGLLYDNGQDSSKTAIEDAKKIFAKNNIEVVEKTGSNSTDVNQAVSQLISSNVEAVFTPTDNTIQTYETSVAKQFKEAKIPHYGGADSFALNGAFCGFGVNYANLGVETAKMALDILINNKDISTYAVKTFDNGIATINTDTCTALGFSYDEIKTKFEALDAVTNVQATTTKQEFDD